jgi:hypothetical protein
VVRLADQFAGLPGPPRNQQLVAPWSRSWVGAGSAEQAQIVNFRWPGYVIVLMAVRGEWHRIWLLGASASRRLLTFRRLSRSRLQKGKIMKIRRSIAAAGVTASLTLRGSQSLPPKGVDRPRPSGGTR